MTPKKRHRIIDRLDQLHVGDSAVVNQDDYDGYYSLRKLIDSYYCGRADRKKFKVTKYSSSPLYWEIKRVA